MTSSSGDVKTLESIMATKFQGLEQKVDQLSKEVHELTTKITLLEQENQALKARKNPHHIRAPEQVVIDLINDEKEAE